jgi:hypothetical protein
MVEEIMLRIDMRDYCGFNNRFDKGIEMEKHQNRSDIMHQHKPDMQVRNQKIKGFQGCRSSYGIFVPNRMLF